MVSGLAESGFFSVGFGISLEALGLVVHGWLVLVGCCWLGGCSAWLLWLGGSGTWHLSSLVAFFWRLLASLGWYHCVGSIGLAALSWQQ